MKKTKKIYDDVKQRAKTTELKAGSNVLVKHTCTKDKLKSYWESDLFNVAKGNVPVIIVKRKRDRKIFARNILMVKKYKHISHSDNRASITDNVENVYSENNLRRLFRIRNPLVPFGEPYTN